MEAGFSVNKEIIDGNQGLDILVALRKCQDGLKTMAVFLISRQRLHYFTRMNVNNWYLKWYLNWYLIERLCW